MIKLKRSFLISLVIILIIAAVVFFVQFTPMGYMLTIKYHGFKEVRNNVFIDKESLGCQDNMLAMIDDADNRVKSFFGDLKGEKVIIVTDNKYKLKKMGGLGHPALTETFVLSGAHNYVAVSKEDVSLDVLAHELTHAEIHSRIYNGKFRGKGIIPVWFDEGLAMQNDYREKYDESNWRKITQDGSEIREITSLGDEKFNDSNKDIRVQNYILAKHEVKSWIDKNSREKVLELLDKLNKGEKFTNLYFK